jgi:hypothetical protein
MRRTGRDAGGIARRPPARHREAAMFLYRLIDTAGSEIEIVSEERSSIGEGDSVTLPNGTDADVVEVYDDEHGSEGGVIATLVVDDS